MDLLGQHHSCRTQAKATSTSTPTYHPQSEQKNEATLILASIGYTFCHQYCLVAALPLKSAGASWHLARKCNHGGRFTLGGAVEW